MTEGGAQEAVLTERRDRVLLVTLNRPDQRNAINAAVARGIAAALDELDADAGLSIGVITGAGKGFCSGMDLKAFVAGESPTVEGRGFAGITQRAAAKPLIAAVEGFAVAGGLEVALSCDLIVAARGARLGIPEVKRGLVAAGGGLLRLPRMLPRNIAMEMALTGDFILAERAAELGLVNRLAEPGAALDAALELAGTIAAN
jgi:enoyl-CoA hydratase